MAKKMVTVAGGKQVRKEARKFKMGEGAICGARRRNGGGKCLLAAGWGTAHPGTGKCKFHMGSLPNHQLKAANVELNQLMGTPVEIDPVNALLWCIRIMAGKVVWLQEQMAQLKPKEWTENTMVGKQLHIWAKEHRYAVADLARYSEMAIKAGIAERAVRLAEAYGEALLQLFNGVLSDPRLALTDKQRLAIPEVVKQHLTLVQQHMTPPTILGGQQRARAGAERALIEAQSRVSREVA